MTRRLRYGLYGLLGGLLVVCSGLSLLLGTQGGSRWLLEQVPGLQVEGFNGRLAGRWSAANLRWQQGQNSAQLISPSLAWSPACLLRLTLCIGQLHSGPITLELPADEQASNEPFSLPDLSLPLALQLGDVQIYSLQLNGVEQLRALQLAARWTAQGIQLDNLSLHAADLDLALQGQVHTTGNWPLQLSGQLQLPAPEQQAWPVTLELSGELRERLQLRASSSGYLQGELSGWLQPLVEDLPAQLRLQVAAFKASAELPDSLTLEQLELTAQGDLQAGYQVIGSASLPAVEGPVALALAGVVKADGADVSNLSLTASPEQQVELSGELNWQQGLSLDSRFTWQNFPWQRLYPLSEAPPVALRTLKGELAYQAGNYLGHFAAELDGPAGAFSLQSPLSGDLQHLYLPELRLQAGQGRAEGQVSLGFAEQLSWDVRLLLSELDPAYWLAELPGNLAGPVNSSGSLLDGQPTLSADIDLKGRLRGQPATLLAKFAGGLQQGELSALDVRLGDNRISGKAALQEQLSGQLLLAMPRLGQLWPGLQGQLSGQLDLAGNLQAPQGQLQLQGQRLAYADQRLQQLSLDARLNRVQRGQLTLQALGIQLGETDLGRLDVTANGDQHQQSLELQLQGPLVQSQLALAGKLDKGNWRGSLSRGQVQSGGQDWRLQQPASLVRLASGQLSLGAHCWRSGNASLCGGEQRLLPEPKLSVQLSNLPMDSLAPWLPKDFTWQGQLNGQLQLELPASGPNGRLQLDAGSGIWRVRDQQQWLEFAYDSLRLNTQIRPQRIDSSLLLRGPAIGELALDATLDPRPASKPLSGSFRLNGLDLALVRPFVPMVERIAGQLNGAGTLSGGLLAPQINGNLRVSNGEIAGGELPMNIEQLQLQARIEGERLLLDGDWRSSEQGQGSLNGELNWAAGLTADMQLRGSRLPVAVEPYAALEVEPDLRLSLRDEQLSVAGKVLIPSGKIEIRELPPSTVQISSDAHVLGRDRAQQQPTAIAMDIDVEVGQERLTFSGFGLNAELKGRVHISNDLDTRGELSLNKGRFRAYGQRLNVRRARLLFAGPIDQPFLDIEAIRQVDDVTAGLRLSGNAAQPTTVVFSEPAMSQEQALSYLVMGRPLGQGGGDNNMLAQAALALGMAGSAPLINNLAQGLGISDFQLDTEGSGVTTSVVASGNLSERLSLRYGVGVFEPANTIALRYELSRKLYLEAASGLASSLDLFYRRDF
ncbi:translocation/assembly module TamB domain-containing protein [Pseudomonas spirodelae]|uniref:Translocation/assembly module TamB domain-containing protein n=1 Tax=Pseudomonas spirodelae TaxID=3101751 RepID=A0ABU5PCL2_9PSED|nr:translocation/assembly module TamB domain-containing protein [Pseudomonas sp. T5W1]MEA1607349.1 translocation/assembly module TamB domain-containing protein [Pseudomonas sp. T5W1]